MARRLARAAVFLASSDASFIAGTELFVDGGQAQIRVDRSQHDS
jgi:NAD(P)-dependent dehydrogenase (short-subunit alcohol dehydrogenase family)